MIKKNWQKLKQNHLLLMVLCCLIPIILIAVFFSLFKNSGNYGFWLIILSMVFLHVLMMRGPKHGETGEKESGQEPSQAAVLSKCPECGLAYPEKDWAEKCETWCKKYKTCNLEITKHAIKD